MSSEIEILPPRYRDAWLIGRGGMGEIYRATDTALDREVAVKLLAERYARDEAIRERFKREALAAARLSGNPNIVTIFDVGDWNERPFIVMEYLSGGSLEERLRTSGAQDVRQTLLWVEQAGRALDSAHAEGVVHRDVKPGNLLLDADGNVHVADFGIARATGMDSLTGTGTILGTVGYLAPEQARGESGRPASDRYALAVVAFELLTGERPFQSNTPAAEAAAHIHGEVPSVAERKRTLPLELDPVFRRALAKEPDERYRTCADFVAGLRRALAEAEETTRLLFRPAEPAPPERPREPPERTPQRTIHAPAARRSPLRGFALVGLLLGGLLGGAALAAALTRDGDGDEAARPRISVRTVTARGTTQRVTVTTTPRTTARATTTPTATTAPTLGTTAGGTVSVRDGIALTDQATNLMRAGRYAEALPIAQRALAALQGSGHDYEAYANYDVGRSLAELGRCAEALPYLDRRERMLGPHPDVTRARRKCGA